MAVTSDFGVAVVGCGTVGNAAAALLLSESELYRKRTNRRFVLKALVDVDFSRARDAGLEEKLFKEDYAAVLADAETHLIVETVGGLTTARTIIEKALKAGKHVVTANKALLAHHGADLFALARRHGVSIGFEASCAGGIPIVRALVDGLSANKVDAVYGIVNGTSNFILTEMVENGKTYVQALKKAQEEGLAEADPLLDVNGMDAAHKLTLLGSLAFGERMHLSSISVKGIEGLDLFDVATGRELGYVLKLLAYAKETEKGIEAAVQPVFLPENHPLARVSASFNAVSVYGRSVGHTMYYGRGAGGRPTASAVVADIISIALGSWPAMFSSLSLWPDLSGDARISNSGEALHRHYFRFNIQDVSGVVADVTAILAGRNISLNSLVQKEPRTEGLVPLIISTHEAREEDVAAAFDAVRNLATVGGESVRLHIIDEHAEVI